jgi:hypothetical protein
MHMPAGDLSTAGRQLAERASDLLERYPDLTVEEVDTLVAIFPMLSAVNLALMASDEQLAPRLQEFRKRHRRRIRPPFRHYAGLLIPILILAIVIASATFR